jgi:hypothetical protein
VISENELKNNYLIESAKTASLRTEEVSPSMMMVSRYLKSA